MQRQILVTGGAGFLGLAIVKKLVARGDSVTSFSRGDYPLLKELGVSQVQGDLSDYNAVSGAVSGKDAVFHVAALPGVWGAFEDYYRTNVTGTENIIAACHQHGVKQLVYTSSPSVVFDGGDVENADESLPYPDHYETHYPKTKAMAEKAVIAAAGTGLSAVILRPHLIWGPGDNHLVPRILARHKRLRRVGAAPKKVDTIYVDNAADAHIRALDALTENNGLSGRIYFISQDDPVNLWEMVDAILDAGGLPPIQKTISPRVAYAAGAVFEKLFSWFPIPGEPPMTRFVAKELATSHWFDISAAKKDLNYTPAISTEEGLSQLKSWLAENPYDLSKWA